jgi:hypothetical protein
MHKSGSNPVHKSSVDRVPTYAQAFRSRRTAAARLSDRLKFFCTARVQRLAAIYPQKSRCLKAIDSLKKLSISLSYFS